MTSCITDHKSMSDQFVQQKLTIKQMCVICINGYIGGGGPGSSSSITSLSLWLRQRLWRKAQVRATSEQKSGFTSRSLSPTLLSWLVETLFYPSLEWGGRGFLELIRMKLLNCLIKKTCLVVFGWLRALLHSQNSRIPNPLPDLFLAALLGNSPCAPFQTWSKADVVTR